MSLFGTLTTTAAAQKDSDLDLNSLPAAVRELAEGIGKARGKLLCADYSHPKLSIEYSHSLNDHSMKSGIRYNAREPGHAQVSVDFHGAQAHNCHNRVKMYAALFGRFFGLSFTPKGSPTTESGATTWTWDLPLEGEVAQRVRDALPQLLDEVAETTGLEARHHRLGDVVGRLERFVPEIESTIHGLDYSFFLNHPWFNLQLAERLANAPNIGEVLRAVLDSDRSVDPDVRYLVVRKATAISRRIDRTLRKQIASRLRIALDLSSMPIHEEKGVARAIQVYDRPGFMNWLGM